MDDVKESVRQGVTKVAGRLSGMASGVMSSIQVRLGVNHQNLVFITYSAYFRESNMPTSPWVFIGTCLVSILCLYGREISTMYENDHRFFGLHRSSTTMLKNADSDFSILFQDKYGY